MNKDKKHQKQELYECERCGAVSDTPQQCCGEPMKLKDGQDQ